MRALTTEDADRIGDLEALLFENSMPPSMVAREIKAGFGYGIGDPLIAYALVRPTKNQLDLTRLAVAPEAQGKGLGKALLQKVLEHQQKVVLTVKKDNYVAIRLYKAHGFRIVGHFKSERALVAVHLPDEVDQPRSETLSST